jgi:hypothetical protein
VKRAVSIDHPRWLVWVTFASILAPLPSALWRLGLATGLSMGFSGERLRGLDVPGWGSLYVVGLSVVSMAPPLLAVIPAGLASVLLTVLTVAGAAGWSREMHVAGSPPARRPG